MDQWMWVTSCDKGGTLVMGGIISHLDTPIARYPDAPTRRYLYTSEIYRLPGTVSPLKHSPHTPKFLKLNTPWETQYPSRLNSQYHRIEHNHHQFQTRTPNQDKRSGCYFLGYLASCTDDPVSNQKFWRMRHLRSARYQGGEKRVTQIPTMDEYSQGNQCVQQSLSYRFSHCSHQPKPMR